jgi:hypothetical protein
MSTRNGIRSTCRRKYSLGIEVSEMRTGTDTRGSYWIDRVVVVSCPPSPGISIRQP